MVEITREDAIILLTAARAQHRALTRMREDMRRNDLVSNDVFDKIIVQQDDLVDVIEKLQKIAGQIPA